MHISTIEAPVAGLGQASGAMASQPFFSQFMFYRRLKKAIFTFALIGASASALADDVSIQTRFGALKTNADGDVQFKGKTLAPAVNLLSSAHVLSTYKLGTSDVVLVSQAGGNACPGQYAFIVIGADGARATPSFGTCYDDEVKPVQVGESIAFSMKKMGGKGTVRYVYERGVVFENGKPVQ